MAQQHHKSVESLIDHQTTVAAFKTMLLDVLITRKEFSADGNATLSLHGEEQERLAKEREQAIINERIAIPGMIKSVDIVNDDALK